MKNTLIQRLQSQPAALDMLLFGFTEDELKSKPIPDKWSIFENLVHLARYHEVFKERMALTATGIKPVFQRYRADDDPGFFEWQQKPLNQVLADFNKDRKEINALLADIPKDKLKHTAQHPFFGLMNIEGWTELFLLHEAHHFFSIVRLGALVQPDRIMGAVGS